MMLLVHNSMIFNFFILFSFLTILNRRCLAFHLRCEKQQKITITVNTSLVLFICALFVCISCNATAINLMSTSMNGTAKKQHKINV
jgi:hypothetical protein